LGDHGKEGRKANECRSSVDSSGHQVTVAISDGAVNGGMPKRALGLIMEWLELHRTELAENWKRAEARLPLEPIEPLE